MVAAILIASATVTGALFGLGAAVVLAAASSFALPELSGDTTRTVLVAIMAAGVVLDGSNLLLGRPGPPTSGRQVPQEWGRLLAPPVVALLYGARLGIGPLTILSTWTWWSMTIASGLAGPMTAVLAGATFGSVRMVVTVLASLRSLSSNEQGPQSHAQWFGRLRTRRRPNWFAITGMSFAAVSLFALAGCGLGGGQAPESPESADAPTTTSSATTDIDAARSDAIRTDATTVTTVDPLNTTSTTEQRPIIRPAELEEFVRAALQDQPSDSGEDSQTQPSARTEFEVVVSSEPDALAEALISEIGNYQPVDDPRADRFLDIQSASQIQPDPTEEIALLETRGYRGGWTRAFRNEANDVAVASVYHFENPAEAEFYLEDGLITIGGYGGKFFDIEQLPGVRGFVQYFTETDDDGTEELVSLGAAFQSGPRWYLVYFVGSVDTVTPEVLFPAITAQRNAAEA